MDATHPPMRSGRATRPSIRPLHAMSATVVGLFVAAHFANHLASLLSVPSHLHFMDLARRVYRRPAVEALLLLCVLFQSGSGLFMVLRGWRDRTGAVAWLQAASGSVMALFLVVHVGAVLFGRLALGLDTNFYYAAAGLHAGLYAAFFAPYYFLAVLAFFAHLGCAAWWRFGGASAGRRLLTLALVVGSAVAAALVLSLAGQVRPFKVPQRYLATFTAG